MRRKHLIIVVSIIVIFFLIGSSIAVKNSFKKKIMEIFRLNEDLKSEDYYLAEFEFKMVGCAYYLDRGQYIKALSRINKIHKQFKFREGLIKVPEFSDKKDKLEFYLNLQNPKTGAFMDDSYPLCTYFGPTFNVLSFVEQLSQEVGEPLRLKYPFDFLDEINTPEKLTAFLDDLSTVGWIGSKFRTPYVIAAELNYILRDLEPTGLYTFSPEWKKALLKWFYNNQDSKTGYWGSKLRSNGQLLNSGDLVSTEKIIKLFIDSKGNNLHPEFPLKYKDEIFSTTLQKLSQSMPEDLDELHDWTLSINRGTRILTRYLWRSASPENKDSARKLMENALRIKFENFYIEHEGGFSLYTGAEHADLDGTGEMLGFMDEIGALSIEKQKLIWGPTNNIVDLGIYEVSELNESNFNLIKKTQDINSIRLYQTDPETGNYISNVVGINYPKETIVPDIIEMLPKVIQWINTTSQNMGNWVTKESILHEDLLDIKIQSVPVSKGDIPLELVNKLLKKNRELIIIGFDLLQVPRYKMIFRVK